MQMQRNKVSNPNTLRFKLVFCLLWSLHPFLSVLPRMSIYGFLFDTVCQTDSFKQGKGTYVLKKEDRALQTCQELQHSIPAFSVLKVLFGNK